MLCPPPVRLHTLAVLAATLAVTALAALSPAARADERSPRDARPAPRLAPGLLSAQGISNREGDSWITLTFRTPVRAEALRGRVETVPPVPLDISTWREHATLSGPLPAGRSVFVRLLAGIVDADGAPVPPTGLTVEMPSFAPDLEWLEGAWEGGYGRGILERNGPATPRLEAVNIPAAEVVFTPIAPALWSVTATGAPVVRPLASADPDVPFIHAMPLPGPGAWRAEARTLDRSLASERIFQATDLAPTVKIGRARSLVVVTRMGDAAPAAGVAVTLTSEAGLPLWRGETDADGLAWAPGRASLPEAPRWIMAAAGDDAVCASLSSERLAAWRLPVDTIDLESLEPLRAWIGTDRPIYRPGETVHVKGFLHPEALEALRARAASSTDTAAPAPALLLEARDARDDILAEVRAPLSALGGFDARFDLPAKASGGGHRITAREATERAGAEGWSPCAERRFEVASYRKAETEVLLAIEQRHAFPGDRVAVSVTARTLFGTPLAGARLRWRAHVEERSFRVSGEARTDARGAASFAITLGEAAGLLVVEATVEDATGEAVTATRALPVRASSLSLELDCAERVIEAGRPLEVTLRARDDGGHEVGADDAPQVALTLVRDIWSAVERATIGGGRTYVHERREEAVATMTARPGSLTIAAPAEAGDYRLRASTPDALGRVARAELRMYVAGEGESTREGRDDGRLTLTPDRAAYRPGERARLLVSRPRERDAAAVTRALLTLERAGVISARWVDLAGDSPLVEVPIEAGHSPNVHACLFVPRGRTRAALSPEGEDLGAPGFVWGAVTLAVLDPALRLPVEVRVEGHDLSPLLVSDAAKRSALVRSMGISLETAVSRLGGPRFAPGAEVEVVVTAAPGAEVCVSVVDDGVLALADEEGDATDPRATFDAPRPLAVETSDVRRRVIAAAPSEVRGKKGRPGGGGGHGGSAVRQDFRSTALFAPTLTADPDGTARVRLRLPDSLTRWRVAAQAASPDGRHGSGTARMTTWKPLMVRAGLPRFLRDGDRFTATAIVHDETGRGLPVSLEAEARGKVARPATFEGSPCDDGAPLAGLRVEVRADRSAAVALPVTVTARGSLEVRLSASAPAAPDGGPALADALIERRPVLSRAPPATAVARGRVVFAGVVAPPASLASVDEGTLTLGTSPLAPLASDLEGLLAYPYGCVEQTSSKTIPLALCADLGLPATEARLAAGVARLLSMQTSQGGFAYWPGDETPHAAGTLYASHALLLARRAAAVVPAAPLARALAAVDATLRDPRGRGRSYALLVLSIAAADDAPRGSGGASLDTPFARRLAPYLESLRADPFTALAALELGRPDHAAAILTRESARRASVAAARAWAQARLASVMTAAISGGAGLGIDKGSLFLADALLEDRVARVEEFSTPLRSDAVRTVARARLGLASGDAARTSPGALLARALRTYERAFTLMALRAVLEARAGGPGPEASVAPGIPRQATRVRVTAGDRTLFDGPLPGALRLETGGRAVVVAADGILDWSLCARGASADALAPAMVRGISVRRVYEPLGGPDPSPAGSPEMPATTRFRRGDVVRVRVIVETPVARAYVALEDPLPAGLEPIDVARRTAEPSLRGAAGDPGRFERIEAMDDRVFASAGWLPAGISELRYLARASTEGAFSAPAPLVEEMYDPEVQGRGEAQRIEVTGP